MLVALAAATALSILPAVAVGAEVLGDSGKIKPEVSMTLPLSEARKAHEQIETTHTRGKIVLNVFAPEKK